MEHRYIELVTYRALADFRSEVSRMYLGILWWVLEPLLYLIVFYVVFGLGLRQASSPAYVPWLLSGLIVWKWLDSTARTASSTILRSAGIMSQVYLPKLVFPAITVSTNFFKFLIIITIFIFYLGFYNMEVKAGWLWLLVLIPLQLLFVAVLASFFAGLVPILPDLAHAINYGMTFLFFASGIFFNVHSMSPRVQHLMHFNPALCLVESFRRVLISGEPPSVTDVACVFAWSLLLAVVTVFLYRKMDRVYPRLVG